MTYFGQSSISEFMGLPSSIRGLFLAQEIYVALH